MPPQVIQLPPFEGLKPCCWKPYAATAPAARSRSVQFVPGATGARLFSARPAGETGQVVFST
eukprot:COSAG06_NODE_2285_length_7166_cov_7.618933_7_plen_61_part_01